MYIYVCLCRKYLEEMFEGMPVVFTGMLHGEELSAAYASGDVFIMPSESETLGLVVLEAMASGTPIVAARAGGIPDIIPPHHEGETGFLFTPGDLEDCVSKLSAVLASAELRSRLSASGRLEVEKHDWRAATRHVRNEYNAAIWFWHKRRHQLSRWLSWLLRRHAIVARLDPSSPPSPSPSSA
jgi:sulfoquinovosyltransferase